MGKGFKPGKLSILVFVFLLGCSYGQQSSRTLSVTDWTGTWSFTGFQVGSDSGDYYHLISSSDANQCALIRETTSNVVTWAKLYSSSQCSGIAFGSSESEIYFANNEAAALGLYKVNSSDGSVSQYLKEATMNISGGISSMIGGKYPGTIFLAGNIRNTSGDSCAGKQQTSTYSFICSSTETYIGGFISIANECYISKPNSSSEIHIRCYNPASGAIVWTKSFNLTSTTEVFGNMKTESNDEYYYIAAESSTLGSIFVIAMNQTDGSIINSVRQRTSSQQLKIGSFISTGNSSSTLYLSTYSSTGTYSELMKLFIPSSDYVIYQQQCIKLKFQHTESSEAWNALQETQHMHTARVSTMGSIMDTLQITQLSNSGLDNVTISETNSTTGTSIAYTNGSFDTSTTATVSDLNYAISTFVAPTESCIQNNTQTVTNTTTENTSDDDLSTLEIVLIIVCCVLVVIIGIGIAIAVTNCIRKSKSRNEGMSKVQESDNPVEERDSLREENKA